MNQRPPQSTPGSCWRKGRWLILFATSTLALGCDKAGVSPYGRPAVKPTDATIETATHPKDRPSNASIKPRSEMENLELAAKAGNPGNYKAQFDLGMKYLEGKDVPQDDFNARKWLTLSAEQGYATAQYQLGLRHAQTGSIIHDGEKAALWLKRAAGQDMAEAQHQLGLMYLQGRVPQEGRDLLKAAQWFKNASEKGNAAAMLQLGMMHANGTGIPRNSVEAATFYELAALRGNTVAQRLLGEAYRDARGVSPNAREAAKWFKLAADADDTRAMLAYARMLADGDGVEPDLIEAYKLFLLVSKKVEPEVIHINTALTHVRNLELLLKPEDVEKVKRSVEEMLKAAGKPLAGPRS